VPALVARAHDPEAALPSIRFDNFEAMCALARRVIFLGRKRIGLISAATESNDRARARVPAIRYAMEKAGISLGKLNVIETDYGIETGALAFKAIMNSGQDPTVVFCGNYVLAVGAMSQTQKMGINVPVDISITGIDNIEIARVVVPELCTLHVPHRKMGAKAAGILVDMVEGRPFPRTTQLYVPVEIRGSLSTAR
jgi:LacI family transcriptional regulator